MTIEILRWVRATQWFRFGHLVLLGLCLVLLGWVAGARIRAGLVETRERVSAGQVPGAWVSADDVLIHVQTWGPHDGPPLLLVHGTGAWAGTWISNVQVLADAGFLVIALDLPPFGYSSLPANGDYGRSAQARRILAVMRQIGHTPMVLLGHSFGGGPVAEAAMQAPEQVSHLVLVDAAIGLQVEPSPACSVPVLPSVLLGWRPLRTALVTAFGTEPVFSGLLLRQFVARTEVVTPERVRLYQQPFRNREFSAGLGDWAAQFVTRCETPVSARPEAFRGFRVPVSLVWGALDSITPLEQAHELKTLLPRVQLMVLPGVGHIPHIEDVGAFNAALLQVLRSPPN